MTTIASTRRPVNELHHDLYQDGQWHADSFRIIYHQLMQDPRPFAILHQQGLKGLVEYYQMLQLAGEDITSTSDQRAAELRSSLVYDDARAFWRSFTVSINRDHSYNERHFRIVSLMWKCLGLANDTLDFFTKV
ncbi:MAG: hypothetical protein U1A25_03270 [Candidatus Sungbacteria bacterium]|nr:hypothetical protein [Candidatus Sungbacteria bacterium]